MPYRLKCGEDTKSISPSVLKTINGGTIIVSKCVVFCIKKSKFIKKQEVKRLIK